MATAVRTKENDCEFSLFKTPLRTPIRNTMISSTTLNDLSLYSNNLKHFKFLGSTTVHNLPISHDTLTTPIRLNKTKFSTPGSNQNRRALGLVNNNNNNNNPNSHLSSSDDGLISINKHDEPVILQAPAPKLRCFYHPEDDLPHQAKHVHSNEDTFDDLIPSNERIERMVTNQINGINIFAFNGGMENTIRCQSPQSSRIDLSTLLDILD